MAHPALLPVTAGLLALVLASPGGSADEPWRAVELFEVRSAEPETLPDDFPEVLAYRAKIVDPRRGGEIPVGLILVPLAPPLSGGRLAAAIDETGDLVALDLIDHPSVSKDEFTTWFTFLFQFLSNPSMGTEEYRRAFLDSEPPVSFEAHLAKVPEDGPDRALLGFLARQRNLMKYNRLLLFHTQRAVAAGKAVDAAWFERSIREFETLGKDASTLANLLEPKEIERYSSLADRAIDSLRSVVEEASAGKLSRETFPFLGRELGQSCQACHESSVPSAGIPLQDHLSAVRERSGLPLGVLEVGYDVALTPGLRIEDAESVTEAIRRALTVDAATR